jgi:hypothetical protein
VIRFVSAAVLAAAFGLAADGAMTQTPDDAFAQGCGGGCHASDRSIVRKLKTIQPDARRAWLEKFMSLHPCVHDDLKPAILDLLIERSRK